MLARQEALFTDLQESWYALDRAERAGEGQAEPATLDTLRQAVEAARQRYVQDGYLPVLNRPEERDASGAETLLMLPAREELPEPAPGGEPVFYHRIGVRGQGRIRLGLGVEPGTTAGVLGSPLKDVCVVHGRGRDAALHIGGPAVDTASPRP